jgi:hypothetical protein
VAEQEDTLAEAHASRSADKRSRVKAHAKSRDGGIRELIS